MKPQRSAAALLSIVLLTACGGVRSSVESAHARPGSAAEPAIDDMAVAQAVGKISVPVDVRYQLTSTPVRDQPTTLQLALVPRVQGENLRVEFPQSESVIIESGRAAFTEQKAGAGGPIRRSIIVTLRKGDVGQVRVLVSMDVQKARFFGIFSIPVGDPPAKPADGAVLKVRGF
jgi:hypothetical protein